MRRSFALFALLLLVSSPARAAEEIGVSRDGVTWSQTLPTPLFDPSVRWVPGDVRTSTFYVRNDGSSAAYLTVAARGADDDRLLADDDIALRARVAGGDWTPLENGASGIALTEQSIARGEVAEIDVEAAFAWESANQSQTKQLALRFDVRLTAAEASDGGGVDPDEGDPDDSGLVAGLLPRTGAGVTLWSALTGLVLLLVGSRLTRRRAEEVGHG
ncbi:MAG: hypothetical protein QM621_07805 [Aeromicrobium sp.]|uniref:hypothetical protein n=1 Tax=Aeromicrobium sp. TaxID=1871063 RepID=UPI0039E28513